MKEIDETSFKFIMASPPTYESYCRERKASLDKHRLLERSRTMSEVVDEILEVVSTEEDVLRATKRATSIQAAESSHATWSLSSSAIMTTWPSGSTVDDDDDEFDTIQKSIQSYTSQLFSPLYEVRPDQQNMFQENRQPLPKPGFTPKVRNLCYNLGTELSYDQDSIGHDEYYTLNIPLSDKHPSCKDQRAHNATERILQSVNPFAVMTSADVNARDAKVELDNFVSPDAAHIKLDKMDTPSSEGTETEIGYNDNQMNQLPIVDFFARKDWMLKENGSADSGELSLEPLLNAYSEDFDLKDDAISDRQEMDHMVEAKHGDNKVTSDDVPSLTAHSDHSLENMVRQTSPPKNIATHQIQDALTSLSGRQIEVSEGKHDMTQIVSILDVVKMRMKQNAFLQRMTIAIPLTPSLLHAIDTSLMTLQSMIATSLLGCSVLVRLEKKRIEVEQGLGACSSTKTGPSMIVDESSGSRNGCFSLDLDTCCAHYIDGKNSTEKNHLPVCDSRTIRPDCEKENLDIKKSDEFVPNCQIQSIRGTKEAPIEVDKKDYFHSVVIPHYQLQPICGTKYAPIEVHEERDNYDSSAISTSTRSTKSCDTIPGDIVGEFIRAFESAEQMLFDVDIDNGDELSHTLSASLPESFDSEQFMKDMALRLDEELCGGVGSYYEEDTSISTLFHMAAVSCESNDGLDEEICALEMFEIDLKNQIEKANNKSALVSLTSPIHSNLSASLSNCSMTTAFLTDENPLSCMSSDDEYCPAESYVRKVHFNEQVEEFLYFAHEACGTPDAKASKRYKHDETFIDEICNVFDDILDELSFACVNISRAMDRTKNLSKIRRSSVS
jgi:hypothetical protein